MPLAPTNVKADAEKLELAKLKGINLSQLFRDALDTSLRIYGSEREMLAEQLIEIEKQIQTLTLEKKLILDQLSILDSEEAINTHRETIYNKWKNNLAVQIGKNSIDWEHQKKLFRFSNVTDCKKWLLGKLKSDRLID